MRIVINANVVAQNAWTDVFKHDVRWIIFPRFLGNEHTAARTATERSKKSTFMTFAHTTMHWHYLIAQSKVQVHLLIADVEMMHSDRGIRRDQRRRATKMLDTSWHLMVSINEKCSVRITYIKQSTFAAVHRLSRRCFPRMHTSIFRLLWKCAHENKIPLIAVLLVIFHIRAACSYEDSTHHLLGSRPFARYMNDFFYGLITFLY